MTQQWNTSAYVGSQWQQAFTLTNADGTLLDLTGLTWEFVIRPSTVDTTSPALISVTTTSSAQGVIAVDLATATLTVTLTPTATGALKKGSYPLALWSNPADTATRTTWVAGVLTAYLTPLP